MEKITTIKVGWDNALYLIVYTDGWTDEVGLDYTTNLIDFKDLLNYHDNMGSTYQVYKIVNGKKKRVK